MKCEIKGTVERITTWNNKTTLMKREIKGTVERITTWNNKTTLINIKEIIEGFTIRNDELTRMNE
jgi:hypothetical protein